MFLEQFPQHSFATERVAHASELGERVIVIRRGRERTEQRRGDCREKVPTAAGGKEGNAFDSERPQLGRRGVNVLKAIRPQGSGGLFGRGIRFENEFADGIKHAFVFEGCDHFEASLACGQPASGWPDRAAAWMREIPTRTTDH